MNQILRWTDEAEWLALRRKLITSTDIPILFGLKPYANSPNLEELWWEKKTGVARAFKGSEATEGGKVYEAAAAGWIARDRGLKLADLRRTFVYDPVTRMGASVDFGITFPNRALLEIKCKGEWQFKSQWFGGANGLLVPQFIDLQTQFQMGMWGVNETLIGVAYSLTRRPAVTVRYGLPSVWRSIKAKTAAFWKSIEEDRPPKAVRDLEQFQGVNNG